MSLADTFIKQVAPALSTTIGYIRTGTAYLGPEDDWIEPLKRQVAVALDPLLAPHGRPLVTECIEDDYFATVNVPSDEVEVAVHPRYQRNETSTRKYRVIDGERQWANGSWVFDPNDTEWQHHIYLFENGDGTSDIYGHKETSAEKDPYGHVTDGQTRGDPDGLTRGELERSGISMVQ